MFQPPQMPGQMPGQMPTVASNGALSPEDQRKRMMIQALQQGSKLTAAPKAAETMTSAINSGIAGMAMGQMMRKQQPQGAPALTGWGTSILPEGM